MNAASGAGMALGRRVRIDDLEFVGIRRDAQFVARYDRDLRKQRTLRLLAFGTAAHVVVGALRLDRHGDGVVAAAAAQRAAGEVLRAWLHAIVYSGMD
jgi:hypothetical protein